MTSLPGNHDATQRSRRPQSPVGGLTFALAKEPALFVDNLNCRPTVDSGSPGYRASGHLSAGQALYGMLELIRLRRV